VHMLLCLCRLCLSRRACTWVAPVNLNNKHNDDTRKNKVDTLKRQKTHMALQTY